MPQPPRPARKGDKITAARQNAVEEYARASAVAPPPGTPFMRNFFGTTMLPRGGAAGTETGWFWIDLIAAGVASGELGRYAWRTVVPDPASPTGFTVSGPTGSIATDPAIEANGFADLPAHTYVQVRRDRRTRRIVFQLENCVA